jgi:hypothetical protein
MIMTRVLVIWEQVPEDTSLYILNPNEAELITLGKCQNRYINCDDNAEMHWLINHLEDKKPLTDYSNIGHVDLIVVAGIIL